MKTRFTPSNLYKKLDNSTKLGSNFWLPHLEFARPELNGKEELWSRNNHLNLTTLQNIIKNPAVRLAYCTTTYHKWKMLKIKAHSPWVNMWQVRDAWIWLPTYLASLWNLHIKRKDSREISVHTQNYVNEREN